ncbi:MAG TPA: hypothetical protein VFX45_12865 [Solirubrobacterales bacterium]|nr:hypothetical protein [Solirubrobacterales bacterium]
MNERGEMEAVREGLLERRNGPGPRFEGRSRGPADMGKWLETEIWPQIPDELLDREPMTKAEVEEILGFGPHGY